ANVCDRVMVMYAGRIVEKADVFELFDNPQHPYTRGLLDSVPRFDANGGTLLKAIKGQPPLLSQLPEGCAFAPRCPHVIPRCESNDPVLQSLHVQSLHDDAQPLSHQRACDVMLPPTDDSTSHREVAS
ncbi:MAG: oligopeptide/dipeptide ABC transporter ATP-binding protein, partial [Planctomycetota bacterium]